jgi:hypothetical protein
MLTCPAIRDPRVLLGTAGGPTPRLPRGASQAIVVGDRVYVVDAGNGVGRQMRPRRSRSTACDTYS